MLVTAVVSASLATGGGATVPSLRDTTRIARVQLPLDEIWTFLVDDERDRLVVSGGPSGDSIVVLDLDGQVLHTVTGLPGPSGMAFHGDALYVALKQAGEIATFDAADYSRRPPVATGLSEPTDLVEVAGRLWTITGCPRPPQPYLYREVAGVDLETGVVWRDTLYPINHQCRLAASPRAPGVLLAWTPGTYPCSRITQLDVTRPVPRAAKHACIPVENLRDVAFLPDGQRFLTAAGAPYRFDEFSLEELQWTGRTYDGHSNPTAIDVGDDGHVVAGMSAASGSDVLIFGPEGTGDRRAKYEAACRRTSVSCPGGGSEHELYPRGLALHPHTPHRFFALVGHQHPVNPSVFLDIVDWSQPMLPAVDKLLDYHETDTPE
jgi:hypothetical protein